LQRLEKGRLTILGAASGRRSEGVPGGLDLNFGRGIRMDR